MTDDLVSMCAHCGTRIVMRGPNPWVHDVGQGSVLSRYGTVVIRSHVERVQITPARLAAYKAALAATEVSPP